MGTLGSLSGLNSLEFGEYSGVLDIYVSLIDKVKKANKVFHFTSLIARKVKVDEAPRDERQGPTRKTLITVLCVVAMVFVCVLRLMISRSLLMLP